MVVRTFNSKNVVLIIHQLIGRGILASVLVTCNAGKGCSFLGLHEMLQEGVLVTCVVI